MKKITMCLTKMPRLRKGKFSVFFCVDDAIATVASHYKKNYEYMYLEVLRFKYDSTKECIGEGICVSNLFNEQLRDYCGITMTFIDPAKNQYNLIKHEIDHENPVFIAMNAYWCPWDWRYQEIEDGGHAIIINGYDEDKNIFLCIDPYYEKTDLELPYELYEKGVVQIACFRKEEDYQLTDVDTLLKKSIREMLKEDFFENLDELKEEIKHRFTFEKEISFYDPSEEIDMEEIPDRVPIVQAFTIISNNRQRYAVMMEHISKYSVHRKEAARQVVEKMIHFAELWDTLRYMLIKGILLNDLTKITGYIPGKLEEIIQMEKQYYELLDDFFNSNYDKLEEKQERTGNKKAKEFICYVLDSEFNNEGIGSFENVSANLNDKGDYFLLDEFVNIMCWNDILFQLSGLENGQQDNLICQGQRLDLKADYYMMCTFLGCSDFGNCYENIKLVYEDETEEYCRIEMPDWQPELQYGEPDGTAFTLKAVENYYGEKSVNQDGRRLYARNIDIDPCKKLVSITLPQLPNIHVFAITFGK